MVVQYPVLQCMLVQCLMLQHQELQCRCNNSQTGRPAHESPSRALPSTGRSPFEAAHAAAPRLSGSAHGRLPRQQWLGNTCRRARRSIRHDPRTFALSDTQLHTCCCLHLFAPENAAGSTVSASTTLASTAPAPYPHRGWQHCIRQYITTKYSISTTSARAAPLSSISALHQRAPHQHCVRTASGSTAGVSTTLPTVARIASASTAPVSTVQLTSTHESVVRNALLSTSGQSANCVVLASGANREPRAESLRPAHLSERRRFIGRCTTITRFA